MPVEQFIAMASGTQFLGNPLLKTQHFIGLSRWEKTSESEVVGRHQGSWSSSEVHMMSRARQWLSKVTLTAVR
ncbi:Scytalone dehydratase-domain-containing protein [Lipomyces tetrasporus]|uniref:Scytalone dehydratase-domain-containing protein n=1 Tax=Lipomyces tetrasporus TaxID=54092 RepID=A0AAD7QKB8_9ASCO|nr:Scytalone dehydratase-domain-containing protein [Lipomyces tetrasporus]KAJ8096663.1 Scytalone dehydratase-domain-containing protein [Lipomyces tetrasporus]